MKQNWSGVTICIGCIFCLLLQCCEEPTFAEDVTDGNRHITSVGTYPASGIIPVGAEIDAWLETDYLPDELREAENIHYCEADKDYFIYTLDENTSGYYRLAIGIKSGYEAGHLCVTPGNHDIELEHCMNYCFHGLNKYGSLTCLGNNQYFLKGARGFTVVEVEKLFGPDSFEVPKRSLARLLNPTPHLDISCSLSLPVNEPGSAVEFWTIPYPAGAWPDDCPEWRIFGCEYEIGEDEDHAFVATDTPFWDTLTVACGGLSYISIGLAVVGVAEIVSGEILNGTPTDFFEEHGAYKDPVGNRFHVVNVNTKEISTKAIPLPDVANSSSNEIASYSEALLPDAWSFTCNGKANPDSKLLMTTDISAGGTFIYDASCGTSSKRFTVYASGVSIMSPTAGGKKSRQSMDDCVAGEEAPPEASPPEVIFVGIPWQEGKYAFDSNLLVPVLLHPIHLEEIENLPVTMPQEDDDIGNFTLNYGELKLKHSGKVRLWHDLERTSPCLESDNYPLDQDTIVYAEGLEHKAESGYEFAQLKLEYDSLIFNCSDEMPVAVLELRPSAQFRFLLQNNDNDDMGEHKATSPRNHESDMSQQWVECEDDLKLVTCRCPLIPPTLFRKTPPEVLVQPLPDIYHSFDFWSKGEKVRNISYEAHVFDLKELAIAPKEREHSIFVEGIVPTGANGSDIMVKWTINDQKFIYQLTLFVLDVRMGVDDGKSTVNNGNAQIDFNDYGSGKEGDFGSYRCVFWVNDDCDCTHWEWDRPQSMGWHEDDFGTNVNCLDDTIGCRLMPTNGINRFSDFKNNSVNDLEDFNRLHIKLGSEFRELEQNASFGSFEFRLANAPINVFKAETEGLEYLTSLKSAVEQAKHRRLLALTPTTWQVIPKKQLNFNGGISPFIWEGCATGVYDLELSVLMKPTKTGVPEEYIGTRRVRLVLRDISSYFDCFGTSASNNISVTKHKFEDGKQQTEDYILFVHGFNVTLDEKRYWPGTMHKRLWWNGYRGRTGIFTWNCSNVNVTSDLIHRTLTLSVYDQSELKAWQTGSTLRELLVNLIRCYGSGNGGKVNVLAHSQGNIVTNEALRQLYPQYSLDTYIASQAAISSSCFQHIDKPYFLEKEYRKKEHGFIPWLTTPDVQAHYPGWNELSPRNQPPYLYSMLKNKKARKMKNYYNPNDWALTAAMETSWEDNNAMRPNLGYGYKGDKHFYNYLLQYKLNFFYEGVRSSKGTVLKFPRVSEDYRRKDTEDTHKIFSFVAQAWGSPIGTNDKTTCFEKHTNLNIMGFGGDHYSHSKQFRSNIMTVREYWNCVFDDCK